MSIEEVSIYELQIVCRKSALEIFAFLNFENCTKSVWKSLEFLRHLGVILVITKNTKRFTYISQETKFISVEFYGRTPPVGV